jgi:hypothetical protein
MKLQRRSEIIIGLLFLIATASYMLGSGLIESVLQGTNTISLNNTQIKIGVLLEIINSAAVLGIASLIFPILRRYSESMTLFYVSSRIVESVLLLICAIGPLLLISFNQVEAQHLNSMITLLDKYLFQVAMLSLSAGSIFLCYVLYRNKLVPRVLSILGLIGYLFLLASSLLAIIGYEGTDYLYIPGALFEVIFPFWLMIKGLNLSIKTPRSV